VDADGRPVSDPASSTYLATVEPAERFGQLLDAEARRRGADRIRQLVVIGDGAAWIWNLADELFPAATQIVDLYHAREHLHDLANLANRLLAGHRDDWLTARLEELDAGDVKAILAAGRGLNFTGSLASERDKALAYFEHNAHRMPYQPFRDLVPRQPWFAWYSVWPDAPAVEDPAAEKPSMRKQHVVVLSEEERARLYTLIGQGTAPARALTHARILLKANQGEAGPGWIDRAVATALEVHHTTVARVRQQYATGGLEAAVDRKAPDREYRRKLDGSRKPTWSRWRAAPRPRGASAGRCGCWPIGSSNWRSWMRSRTRPSARPYSKPPQAVVEAMLVHSPRPGWRVLLADGGRAGGLYPAV
jgi:hypothetical protein